MIRILTGDLNYYRDKYQKLLREVRDLTDAAVEAMDFLGCDRCDNNVAFDVGKGRMYFFTETFLNIQTGERICGGCYEIRSEPMPGTREEWSAFQGEVNYGTD